MFSVDIWKLLWDKDLLNLVKDHTILYATRDKNHHNFQLSMATLHRVFGIILFSGNHSVPSERDLVKQPGSASAFCNRD